VKNFVEKSVDNLSFLSYSEEIAIESQNEWYEAIVNEFPANIIRNARFLIDSIPSGDAEIAAVENAGA